MCEKILNMCNELHNLDVLSEKLINELGREPQNKEFVLLLAKIHKKIHKSKIFFSTLLRYPPF